MYAINYDNSRHSVLRLIWWRHQMESFSALLALCEGNPPFTGGFPSQRQVTRSFDVFFYLRLDKPFSNQSRRRWFEMPSRSLWRHCNGSSARYSVKKSSTWHKQQSDGFCWISQPIMTTSSNVNIFRVSGPLCGEFTGHRWIPLTKVNDAGLWCFLWSTPE